jgi:hypothetical protein
LHAGAVDFGATQEEEKMTDQRSALLVYGPSLDRARINLDIADDQRGLLDFNPPGVLGLAPEKLAEIAEACALARQALQHVVSALLVADTEARRMADAVRAEQHKHTQEAGQ